MAQRVHRLPGHVAVRILSRTGTESTTAAAQELFVYLDATRDVAYVVHDGGTGLHWEDFSAQRGTAHVNWCASSRRDCRTCPLSPAERGEAPVYRFNRRSCGQP